MVKTREIDLALRGSIKTLKDEGYSSREIGRKLNLPFSSVNYTLRRFEKTKSYTNIPRIGRPRATSSRIDKKILDPIENSDEPNATDVAKQFAALNIASISPKTVYVHILNLNSSTCC
jgi:hypothetical protein